VGLLISYDTMVAAHLLNEERGGSGNGEVDRSSGLSLLNLASIELGIDNWGKKIQIFGEERRPPTGLWGPDGMGTYCARDVGYTHMIYERQRRQLSHQDDLVRLLKVLILPGLSAVLQMEINGIWVDLERALSRREILEARYNEAKNRALQYVPDIFKSVADLDNDNWVRKWFFTAAPQGLGLQPVTVTAKTKQPQLNEHVYEVLADRHPAASAVHEMRKATKAIQFIDQWFYWADAKGRIHPHFNITGTVTGRRSCDKPNLQQVPRDTFMRSILGAPPGWLLLEVDYSQIEVRLAAWFAGEENMLDVYAKGGDIYVHTAAALLGCSIQELQAGLAIDEVWAKEARRKAKAVVLGFLYGMSASSFRAYARAMYDLNLTEAEAADFREKFFRIYPKLVTWHREMKYIAHKNLEVRSVLGRVRHLIGILSADGFMRSRAVRQAINSPVQGTGGDLTLAANLALSKILDPAECLIVGDVHDALLFQVRADVWKKWARVILETMERPPAILQLINMEPPVRLKAEGKIGTHWGSTLEFSLEELDGIECTDDREAT
jgi:DNA polymerase I-like protein with 3'-5' exonuclease and polymerase domains